MTSKIKVDNINKVSDDSNIINKCGSTTTVGSGAGNTVVVCGSTVTLGRCGGTVALASGATQTGFGRTGTVDWQTAIKTATFTAVSGEGYFCNTTAGSFTLNLPSSPSVGDIVSFKDYARTFQTNNLTVGRGGSNMDGSPNDTPFTKQGLSATLIYMDATKGWSLINDDETKQTGASFIAASGGTVTTCGNFKIHTFTGPGTFTVSSVGNCAGSNTVSYVVVAGGGGGGTGCSHGAGAGAGGYRESKASSDSYTASPLNATSGPTYNLPVSASPGSYSIVVGGGGAGATSPSPKFGASGGTSSFSTITSAGGGSGGGWNTSSGVNGGSGSGSACGPNTGNVGAGNTPPVTPPQGNPGGAAAPCRMGGGGGAGEAGNTDGQGHGGDGVSSEISAAAVTRAGGGGGAGSNPGSPVVGGDGGGGFGAGPCSSTGGSATVNTGGGGGGSYNPGQTAGSGGSGIVIIRYRYQ